MLLRCSFQLADACRWSDFYGASISTGQVHIHLHGAGRFFWVHSIEHEQMYIG